jgi:hypothetical protein
LLLLLYLRAGGVAPNAKAVAHGFPVEVSVQPRSRNAVTTIARARADAVRADSLKGVAPTAAAAASAAACPFVAIA